jgi:alanine dehydrogenase
MKLAVPKETAKNENRVSLIPKNVKDLITKGFQVKIESALGKAISLMDEGLHK